MPQNDAVLALELVHLLARMEVREPSEDAEIDALHTMNRLICEARTILATLETESPVEPDPDDDSWLDDFNYVGSRHHY